MGNTIIKTMPVEYEAIENYGAGIFRYGKMRMLWLPSGTFSSSWVLTIPEKDRPPKGVTAIGSVFNGSSYVTCMISIYAKDNASKAGRVTVSDNYGADISGMQMGYCNPHLITYFVE